jgi:Xaa-Pro aminopeptidase
MKNDLDFLMQNNGLDALIVTGSAQHNPAMVYLTGIAHMTGDLIKKRGADPVLFHGVMEREEAAKSGLPLKSLESYDMKELLKQFEGDFIKATAERYKNMLTDLGITSGKVALYGKVEVGSFFAIFQALQEAMPDISLVGELTNQSTLLQARLTKGEDEIKRIRQMGQITTAVVAEVADFLSSHRARKGVLIQADDQPLTIGDVKSRIDLWLAERGADNPEGVIFSIGRDAAIPHSSGTSTDLLRLGQTIVFDIYPCEKGGGYFYDFTRTWCLGYATDEVLKLYEDVRFVFKQMMSELKTDTHCPIYQRRTCELFEAQGHPTLQGTPRTEKGYIHSLGHGVGLNIHERPWFGMNATAEDRLVPGAVFTVEPGLYYPDQGMGVRLEDTVYVRLDGNIEPLVEYPLDLILPVKE